MNNTVSNTTFMERLENRIIEYNNINYQGLFIDNVNYFTMNYNEYSIERKIIIDKEMLEKFFMERIIEYIGENINFDLIFLAIYSFTKGIEYEGDNNLCCEYIKNQKVLVFDFYNESVSDDKIRSCVVNYIDGGLQSLVDFKNFREGLL